MLEFEASRKCCKKLTADMVERVVGVLSICVVKVTSAENVGVITIDSTSELSDIKLI